MSSMMVVCSFAQPRSSSSPHFERDKGHSLLQVVLMVVLSTPVASIAHLAGCPGKATTSTPLSQVCGIRSWGRASATLKSVEMITIRS